MIAIIGGYGKVGINACQLIYKWGKHPLKIGGRNPEKGKYDYVKRFPDAQWEKVDLQQDESIQRFVKNCTLVINCAGPSHKISEKVAKICISEGCHLVDAGFERKLEKIQLDTHQQVVLYAAGATPGLSGIVPRWFAQKFDQVQSILTYIGALDKFTPTGAEDYLEGVLDDTNSPMACWKNGALCKGALKRKFQVHLPFFQREVSTFPIFDSETQFLAQKLHVEHGEWYCAIDGSHIEKALDTASAQYKTNPKETIDKLCLATALDTIGVNPYFNMLVELNGIKNKQPVTQTAVFESKGTVELTGIVTAICAIAILNGKIKPGIRPAAQVDQVDYLMKLFIEHDAIKPIRIFENPIRELLFEDEGVL